MKLCLYAHWKCFAHRFLVATGSPQKHSVPLDFFRPGPGEGSESLWRIAAMVSGVYGGLTLRRFQEYW